MMPMKTKNSPSTSLSMLLERSVRRMKIEMNANPLTHNAVRLTALLLLVALSVGFMGHINTSAQSKQAGKAGRGNDAGKTSRADKASSDLRERMRDARASETRVSVILQLDGAAG